MVVYYQTVGVSRHSQVVVPVRVDSLLHLETLSPTEQFDFEGTAFRFVSESTLAFDLTCAPHHVVISLPDRTGCGIADCECISAPT